MSTSSSFILPGSGLPERRSWPRIVQLLHVLVLPEDCAVELPYPALLLDRSAGGLRLALHLEEIEEGMLLQIRPTFSAGKWVLVRVKNRRAREHTWEMGCAFPQSPCWEGVRAFGSDLLR